MPTIQGRTQNTLIRGGGGGGTECRRYDVSGVSREGGEYERGVSPLSFRGSGESRSTREEFLSLFFGKSFRFQT